MRLVYLFAFSCCLFTACSKKQDDAVNTPPPSATQKPDTLTAGWTKIMVTPGNAVNDIFFTDNNNGYLAGGGGIYRSVNGGAAWTRVNTAGNYYNIAAFANKAVFCNGSFSVLQTSDAASTFQTVNVGDYILDAYYPSSVNCHLVSNTKIYNSTDGGNSFPFNYNFGASDNYATLSFLSDLTGWEIKGGTVYKTTDGGASWTAISTMNVLGNAIEFLDVNNGYFSTPVSVYKTTNGGNSWQRILLDNNSTGYTDIDFVSVNEGYVTNGNEILKTGDGGISWTKVVALGQTNFIELHFTDAAHGWACCFDGSIVKFN